MADNTTLSIGTGGDANRSVQRGGASGPKSSVVGLDLTPGGASETLMDGSMPVTAASLPLPSGAASETTIARRFAAGSTITRGVEIADAGANTVRTPASGKFLRLHWIGLATKDDSGTEVIAIVKFGAVEHYRWPFGSPGLFSHWQLIDGAVDQPLVVDLSAGRTVQVNYTVEELTP